MSGSDAHNLPKQALGGCTFSEMEALCCAYRFILSAKWRTLVFCLRTIHCGSIWPTKLAVPFLLKAAVVLFPLTVSGQLLSLCWGSAQMLGSMLHPHLACYPLIRLLASLCLFEATGRRRRKGCLVRDISLVGRGVIAS